MAISGKQEYKPCYKLESIVLTKKESEKDRADLVKINPLIKLDEYNKRNNGYLQPPFFYDWSR